MEERFDGPTLDRSRWLPAYMPAWSSREAARATWVIGPDGLELTIPPEHPVWCRDLHDPPLKVSAIQSGNRSGPVGSGDGQQPFRSGLVVTEFQPEWRGLLLAEESTLEVELSATIGADAMVSVWTVGFEDAPQRCGELCVMEVFGDAPDRFGTGVHPFRDPALVEEFSADPQPEDVAERHRYGLRRHRDGTDFQLDGRVVRRSAQRPAYPVQVIIAVFEFPARAPHTVEPRLTVHSVTARGEA